MVKLHFYLLLLLGVSIVEVSAQDTSIIIDMGLIGRTVAFYHSGTKGLPFGRGINPGAPYSYQKGVNGIGLNASVGYRLSKRHGINVEVGSTIRYDFYYWEFPNGKDGEPVNTFYVDFNGLVTKSIYKSFYGGIGFTIYNIGKELTYNANNEKHTLQLAFSSIDFLVGLKVKKIYIEPKFSIVQQNFPGTIKDNATLLGIRIYYRFLGAASPK